jgi:hypothetical protein
MVQVDMPRLAELLLDGASLGFDHGRIEPIQTLFAQEPIDCRERRRRGNRLPQRGKDLLPVETEPALLDDPLLDRRRCAIPLPSRSPLLRRQRRMGRVLKIPVLILAESLRAGSVRQAELSAPTISLRFASLYFLIFTDQEPPPLHIVAVQRQVVAVVAHSSAPDPVPKAINEYMNSYSQ